MDEFLSALESLGQTSQCYAQAQLPARDMAIKINRVGELMFPLSNEQQQALLQFAKPAPFGFKDETIYDDTIRKALMLPKSYTRTSKKTWDKVIQPILNEFKTTLGLPSRATLRAEFQSFLIYEEGGFFQPHQDTEKVDGMIGSLVIMLPTEHEGGDLIIEHAGKTYPITFKKPRIPKYNMVAFYADCLHEVKPVKSGVRMSLTYNLILEKYKGSVESLFESDTHIRLVQAIKHYFAKKTLRNSKPRRLVYLLDHQYTQKSLHWQNLKGLDITRVEAILAASDELGLSAYLALADVKECWECESHYDEYRSRHRYDYDDEDEEDDYDEEDDEENAQPDYILDTELSVQHWIDRDGKVLSLKQLTLHSDEACWTGDNEDFEPFDTDYIPWAGNYGNTLDRWYHRAVLILEPKK